MAEIMMDNPLGVVDKRRVPVDDQAHHAEGNTVFTGNAAGTTTTLVGANAAPGTNDNNVMRRGDKFKLFTSAGVLKEEKVFRVTDIAVAASTTVTFTPAAAAATASGDIARLVTYDNYMDNDNIDRRLTAINATSYSAERLRQMTRNDKIFALRSEDDPGGF